MNTSGFTGSKLFASPLARVNKVAGTTKAILALGVFKGKALLNSRGILFVGSHTKIPRSKSSTAFAIIIAAEWVLGPINT
jgi:hypothetical protein